MPGRGQLGGGGGGAAGLGAPPALALPGGRGAAPLTLLHIQLPDLCPAEPADTGGVREEDAREEEPIEMYLFYVYFQCSILVY